MCYNSILPIPSKFRDQHLKLPIKILTAISFFLAIAITARLVISEIANRRIRAREELSQAYIKSKDSLMQEQNQLETAIKTNIDCFKTLVPTGYIARSLQQCPNPVHIVAREASEVALKSVHLQLEVQCVQQGLQIAVMPHSDFAATDIGKIYDQYKTTTGIDGTQSIGQQKQIICRDTPTSKQISASLLKREQQFSVSTDRDSYVFDATGRTPIKIRLTNDFDGPNQLLLPNPKCYKSFPLYRVRSKSSNLTMAKDTSIPPQSAALACMGLSKAKKIFKARGETIELLVRVKKSRPIKRDETFQIDILNIETGTVITTTKELVLHP